MGETFDDGDRAALASTKLTERELLIHAVQHLEMQDELIGRMLVMIEEMHAEMSTWLPLLRTIAPDGKVTVGGMVKAKLGRTGGQRVWNG